MMMVSSPHHLIHRPVHPGLVLILHRLLSGIGPSTDPSSQPWLVAYVWAASPNDAQGGRPCRPSRLLRGGCTIRFIAGGAVAFSPPRWNDARSTDRNVRPK
jgi:hypothetical protein